MTNKMRPDISVTITAYITKYALSRGIVRCRVEYDPQYPRMVKVKNGYNANFHGEGKDWHRSLEGAVTRAEEMRIAALQVADKRIKKLSAMTFLEKDVKDGFVEDLDDDEEY